MGKKIGKGKFMSSIQTGIHRQVEACRQGTFERFIGRTDAGFIIMGASQVLRGYCLLLPHSVPPHLNALPMDERVLFLKEMTLVGQSIIKVVSAVRINYEILGNLEPALHAHIIPRFNTEPGELRTLPYWKYPQELIDEHAFCLEKHQPLMEEIRQQLSMDNLIGRFF